MKASDYPYESFNARALSPSQVAIGFVPPEAFQKLCKRRHSIVAGPRGSGKTTLLKMLQVSALRTWRHELADATRDQIDFTGVFIPTDRTWSEQLCAVGAERLAPNMQEILGVSAFTTQVLRALISACIERTSVPNESGSSFRGVQLSPAQQVDLSRRVAAAWSLSLDAATLLGLRATLGQRLMKIHQLANQCTLIPEDKRAEFLMGKEFLHIGFLSAVPAFLDIFEDVTGLVDERWALLFDELELAPRHIRTSLTQALRSVDQRLIFKLSIAPFSKELEDSAQAASDHNDFDLIKLWYPSKEDGYPFSKSLIKQMLEKKGIKSSIEHVFGPTPSENTGPTRGKEYHQAGVYRNLARKDHGFRRYLIQQGINLDSIHQRSETEKAAVLRKVVSLVILRDTYLKSRGPRSQSEPTAPALRSRKSSHIYCGVPALLAVSEGNPRWLIGLIDRFLDSMDDNDRVPITTQDREVNLLIGKFSAFLRTIPMENAAREGRRVNIFGLVDSIGKSLTKEVLEKPFNPDPIGTFIVDSHASEPQIRALEQAIYAGAVVFVPESENEIASGSIRGKRFRLTYLLAPKYKLPLVLLRPKSLGALLASPGSEQEGLFQ